MLLIALSADAAIITLVVAQAGSIVASELELAGPVAAAQGILEEVLELLVPGLVLAAALPAVGPPLARAISGVRSRST